MDEEIDEMDMQPFAGLFGDSHLSRIIAQIIADPFEVYRPKDLEELAEASAPSTRKALRMLTKQGLLIRDDRDKQHPTYKVNIDSKKYMALTLLSYSVVDDDLGTDCMDDLIAEYYDSDLRERYESNNDGSKEIIIRTSKAIETTAGVKRIDEIQLA
ncbi:MAG: hypothetical protein QG666_126 [Euryarchaeota archaeon]|nr:hypothetical protein [Euryarchaeota archaeon]MDQ1312662.1 hypothetical protein [Euryarchaeota archaeon]